jgi:GST-like protein
MIDLYTWTTPNGRKVSIMLEETGLPYRVIPVDLGKGEQQTPEFTAVSPNQKIPAIVDHDLDEEPIAIFESGAILIHLAERTGQFLPADPARRAAVLQWLMYQMSHVGPIIGQAGHFANDAPKTQPREQLQYATLRFIGESLRILGVLDAALGRAPCLAGDYSIADMATYPWVEAAWGPFSAALPERVAALANVKRWLADVAARPAVARGMQVPAPA